MVNKGIKLRSKFRSMGLKLTLAFLGVGLIPLIVSSIFNGIITKEIIDFSETKTLFSMVQLQTNVIKNSILIRHTEVNNFLKEAQLIDLRGENKGIQTILEFIRSLKLEKNFYKIIVFNEKKEKMFFLGSDHLQKRPLKDVELLNPTNPLIVTPFYLNKKGEIEQTIWTHHQIQNKKYYISFSHLLKSAPGINQIVLGLEMTGSFYNGIREEGLIHFNNMLENSGPLIIRDENLQNYDVFELEEGIRIYEKLPGLKSLAIQFELKEYGLYVLIKKDWKEIYSQLNDWNTKIIGGILATTLIIIILAIFFSKYLSSPLIRLKKAMQEIMGSGNLDTTVEIERNDEIGELAKSFNELILNLKIADHTKKQFVHVLCHDLKNPIGAASLALELCMMKPEKMEQYIPKAMAQLKNGNEVIDLVRTMSALEDSKMKLDLSPLNLLENLQKSLQTLDKKIESKGLNLNINIDKDIKVMAKKLL